MMWLVCTVHHASQCDEQILHPAKIRQCMMRHGVMSREGGLVINERLLVQFPAQADGLAVTQYTSRSKLAEHLRSWRLAVC